MHIFVHFFIAPKKVFLLKSHTYEEEGFSIFIFYIFYNHWLGLWRGAFCNNTNHTFHTTPGIHPTFINKYPGKKH